LKSELPSWYLSNFVNQPMGNAVLGIFLDTETNGLNPYKHKVIEIAFQIYDVLSGELKDEFQSIVSMSPEEWQRSDPESLQVNGFKWNEVQQGVPAFEVGSQIQDCFAKNGIKRGKAVFICQNPSFDRIYFSQLVDPDVQEKLGWPYHWLDLASMYWSEAMKKGAMGTGKYPWETGFSKDKIAVAMQLPTEEQPHRAMNGVKHLLLCYKELVGFPGILHSDRHPR
jgi:oligoribonuclease